jgi:hypothetical protein
VWVGGGGDVVWVGVGVTDGVCVTVGGGVPAEVDWLLEFEGTLAGVD